MRRYPYDAAAGVDKIGTGWEEPEGGEEIRRRGAVNGRGRVGASVRGAVVVVLLRQLLLGVVAPGPPAVLQDTAQRRLMVVVVVVVVIALLPGPFSLLVAVRLLRGRAFRWVSHAALPQQTTYAERVAPGGVVRQRSRAGLTRGWRGRALGRLLGHVAAVVARVISRTAATRIRVVHVDLLRRVHVAVAAFRHGSLFPSRELLDAWYRLPRKDLRFKQRVSSSSRHAVFTEIREKRDVAEMNEMGMSTGKINSERTFRFVGLDYDGFFFFQEFDAGERFRFIAQRV